MRRLLALISILFALSPLFGQQKTVYKDVSCYVHLVKKGNTLYGVAKQYALPLDELIRFNDNDDDGLQVGERLYIPIEKVDRKALKKGPELVGSILEHKVQRGETLFSLSKKYRLEVNQILEANPQVEGGVIQKGMVIRIPTYQVAVKEEAKKPARPDGINTHTVVAGETIYGLTKLYALTEETLREANRGIPEGLKVGMVLQIPDRIPDAEEGGEKDESVGKLKRLDISSDIDIGLLLPFDMAGKRSDELIPEEGQDLLTMTQISYEFYRGARLALDELEKDGLRADVHVLDVSRNGAEDLSEQQLKRLTSMDLIIGPLHSAAFSEIARRLPHDRPPLVSPLSRNLVMEELKAGDTQVLTDIQAELEAIVGFILAEDSILNPIVLGSPRKSHHEFLLSRLNEDTMRFQSPLGGAVLLEDEYLEVLKTRLSADSKNVIILPILDRPVITDLMAKLTTTEMKEYDFMLIGLSDLMRYENLDLSVLERLHLVIPMGRNVDWNDKAIQQLTLRFADDFATTPGPQGYGLQAYDLIRYYVRGVMEYGQAFMTNQEKFKQYGLQTGFELERTPTGAYRNNYCRMYRYSDGKLIPFQ